MSRRWTAYVAPKLPNSVTVEIVIRQMARFTYLWSNPHTTITCLLSDCLSHYGDVRCALAVRGSGPICCWWWWWWWWWFIGFGSSRGWITTHTGVHTLCIMVHCELKITPPVLALFACMRFQTIMHSLWFVRAVQHMLFLRKDLAVWFLADQESACMAYRPTPSHFHPCTGTKLPLCSGSTSEDLIPSVFRNMYYGAQHISLDVLLHICTWYCDFKVPNS